MFCDWRESEERLWSVLSTDAVQLGIGDDITVKPTTSYGRSDEVAVTDKSE